MFCAVSDVLAYLYDECFVLNSMVFITMSKVGVSCTVHGMVIFCTMSGVETSCTINGLIFVP